MESEANPAGVDMVSFNPTARPIRRAKVSEAEMDAARSPRGGWSAATLAGWGVPWPAPRGWRKALLRGDPIPGSPERKRGRPPVNGETKVGTVTFRTTGDLRQRLAAAAASSGLSITQEVERRLERTFLTDDMRRIIREELDRGSVATASLPDEAPCECGAMSERDCSDLPGVRHCGPAGVSESQTEEYK